MTKFLLIRHGAHDLLGRVLAGRMPGVALNGAGRAEAEGLPGRLAHCVIDALYSSPMERTLETAAPLAAALGLPVQVHRAFHEIDFGDWTGRTFGELDPDAEWQRWNSQRTQACPPKGETMLQVQQRFIGGLRDLAQAHRNQVVGIISHGDPIKSALFHALGVSLDHMANLEISPASINLLHLDYDRYLVTLVNELSSLPSQV